MCSKQQINNKNCHIIIHYNIVIQEKIIINETILNYIYFS